MLEKNEKGKQARQYFIQVEKDWSSPDKVMARALKIAEIKLSLLQVEVKQKEQLIGELNPKADYVEWILKSKGTVNINAIAKDYGMSAKALNKILHELKVQYYQDKQWLLYAQHQSKGYLWWTDDNSNPKYNPAQDMNTSMAYSEAKEKRTLATLPEIKVIILYMQGHVGVYMGNGRFIELMGGGVGAYEGKIENGKIVKGSKFTH